MFRSAAIVAVAVLCAIGAAGGVVAVERTLGPRPAVIVRAADGHFWAEGEAGGAAVRFLVDTGATSVALTRADAARLGLTPGPEAFTQTVTTAAGPVRAAPVRLEALAVGPARLEDVHALVVEDGLHASLLGMSYLGRLQRIEATPRTLILRP